MERMVKYVDQLVSDWNKQPHVLLVEDDPVESELMRRTLTEYGCEVVCCRDAEEAEAFLRGNNNAIDIIFLDLKFSNSGGTGVDVLKVQKQTHPKVPVVVVTGCAQSDVLSQAMRLGYFGLVEKPLTKPLLKTVFGAHKLGA